MRLVATINFGNLHYGNYTLPSIRRYAHRCQADFLEITQYHGEGHPARLQIDYLATFAKQDHYTQLMLVDLDCMIRDDCGDLFAMVGDNLGQAIDMGFPVVKEGGFLWESYREELRGRDPGIGLPYYNAGLIVLSLDVAREIMPRLAKPFFAQQHELNICLRNYQRRFVIPETFNWMAPQLECAKQQKIVHFGGHKNLIAGFRW